MINSAKNLPPGTILGFDFGLKKIGVATGQLITSTAKPFGNIPAQNGIPNQQMIKNLFNDWQVVACVVGLPFNADGTESELVPKAKKFGNRIHANYKIPVFFIDEHLSSCAARDIQTDFPKMPIDAIAAMIILESWLQTC